ncbi:MAG TPA: alpha/beta fold hydrolase [Gammaproteobacteria bacterium]|nr:alpha/beta fold hydrolase [Gammaproteobacteria bacterium]
MPRPPPMAVTILVWLALAVLGVAALRHLQDRLIYYPGRYARALDQLPATIEPVRYTTASGEQIAFLLPANAQHPPRVWLVFGGNADLALNWADWLLPRTHAGEAFFLIDYPGYGYSEGNPSAQAIRVASYAAFEALAARLEEDPRVLRTRTCLLGHSIGAAAALELAVRHPPRCLMLVAPFTTLRAIGQHVFGGWIGPLVRNDYDNIARLAELEPHAPAVYVVHGARDTIIPARFGRELASRFPWIRYHEVPQAGHNDIFAIAGDRIRQLMVEGAASQP